MYFLICRQSGRKGAKVNNDQCQDLIEQGSMLSFPSIRE